jgi:hypothetical protein
MVAVVSVETVLLVILVVLVAGLLRSHAEILRRLGAPERSVPPPASTPGRADAAAPTLAGSTPDGDAVSLAFDGAGRSPTLLAFLTTGCTTCATFWETLGERRLPPGVQTVIVTHGSEREQPAKLLSLAPDGVPIVMSSAAWEDYAVPGSPYFVLVDGAVKGEGMASSWKALASLVSDAIEDERVAAPPRGGGPRAERIDEVFAAAGIGPDDPSLYPDGEATRR